MSGRVMNINNNEIYKLLGDNNNNSNMMMHVSYRAVNMQEKITNSNSYKVKKNT